MVPVVFGAAALFGAAMAAAAEEETFAAVSHSMGGRGPGAGAGAASSMGGRQVETPYEWDTPSGTVMRWDVPGGIFAGIDFAEVYGDDVGATVADLQSANRETGDVIRSQGGKVLETGDVHMEGAAPAFYTVASFPSPRSAHQALQATKAVGRAHESEGDCVWLFAGGDRYVALWSTDDDLYFSRWWAALNASGGEVLDVRKVFSDDFGFMLFGIPFGRESRMEHLEKKIERAQGKLDELEEAASVEGANVARLAKKIARYEQKKEKWEDKLETLQMKGESMGFHDEDEFGYTSGAIGSYDLLGASVAEAMFEPDWLADDDDDDDDEEFGYSSGPIGSYDRLGSSVAEAMFEPDLMADDDEDDEEFGLIDDDYFPPGGSEYGTAVDQMLEQRYGHYRGTSYGAGWGADTFGSHDPAALAGAMRQLRGGMTVLEGMEGGGEGYGYSGGVIGSYDLLGDRIAGEMFGARGARRAVAKRRHGSKAAAESARFGAMPGAHQRTAIEMGEHILS